MTFIHLKGDSFVKKKKEVNKLFYYLWKYKHLYLIGVLVLLIVDYANLYLPQFTGEITDGLAAHTIDSEGIRNAVLKMMVCAGILSVGRFAYRYFVIGTARKVEHALQNEIFAKLETLSQRYYNENKTGDLMAYFTNDLEAIRDAIGWSVISAFDAIVLTFMCLYKMMTYVSVTLTLYTLIPMIGVGIYGFNIFKAFDKHFEMRQESFAKLNDVVQESISAERVIKAFVEEDNQLENFKKANESHRQINMKVVKLRAYAWPVMEVFISAAFVIAILFGGYYCLIGEITIGKMVTFSS